MFIDASSLLSYVSVCSSPLPRIFFDSHIFIDAFGCSLRFIGVRRWSVVFREFDLMWPIWRKAPGIIHSTHVPSKTSFQYRAHGEAIPTSVLRHPTDAYQFFSCEVLLDPNTPISAPDAEIAIAAPISFPTALATQRM